jgi:beta-glucosidase
MKITRITYRKMFKSTCITWALLTNSLIFGSLQGEMRAFAQTKQIEISTHTIPLLTVDGLQFRDLNRNGKLDVFEDWRRVPRERARDLLLRLTLEEKAGLMMHATAPSTLSASVGRGKEYDLIGAAALIQGKLVNSMITRLAAEPSAFATQNNLLQELAEKTPFGIPLTISTDPRNTFENTFGAGVEAGEFSKWPTSLGLAAVGDPSLTRRFGEVARKEYGAVGINEALSPQADLATEPRWPRIDGTFGEDASLSKRMVEAYINGFQDGETGLHAGSVLCVVKHWVGYGAAKDGWDSHNSYGKHADLSGGDLSYHQIPFQGAFAAHVGGVMPTYSILDGVNLDGKDLEPVAAGFNKQLLTTLLRGKYGFQGVILSDWLITNNCEDECLTGALSGKTPSITPGRFGMSWGVEDLTPSQRFAKAIEAGVDQFGGVAEPGIVTDLVRNKQISEQRIDESAYRILLQKFEQGLFDNPFVKPARAPFIVGSSKFVEAALDAQHRSMVLLLNRNHVLPLKDKGKKVFLYGIDPKSVTQYGLVPVDSAEKADFAIMRMNAPYQHVHPNFFFGSRQHEGDLDFHDEDQQFEIFKKTAAKVPTIVNIYLDRPAILTQLTPLASVIVANFGASDKAVLDVMTGRAAPEGKLPFELPSSSAAVLAQKSDLPHDSTKPLYPIFYGLHYENWGSPSISTGR